MTKVKKSEHDMTLLDHLIELRNRLFSIFLRFPFSIFSLFH